MQQSPGYLFLLDGKFMHSAVNRKCQTYLEKCLFWHHPQTIIYNKIMVMIMTPWISKMLRISDISLTHWPLGRSECHSKNGIFNLVLLIGIFKSSHDNALGWMSQDLTDNKSTYPASREMLDRRWANVVTYLGATSANDVGPTWICPSVQRWHNVVTHPTMKLCQHFANIITYCILLDLMVGTTFAICLYQWLAKYWHNFIIAHCL